MRRRVQVDELETARQAVTEGQAMVTFVDWTLRGTGKTVADVPDIGKTMKDGAADATGVSTDGAGRRCCCSGRLSFRIRMGWRLSRRCWKRAARGLAFAGGARKSAELEFPGDASVGVPGACAGAGGAAAGCARALLDAEYEPYDVGVMGELDVEMMASLFGGARRWRGALAPAWDGGVYYAGQRRAASVAEKGTTGSLAVIYFSRWKSDEAAVAFEKLYAGEVGRKYRRVSERKADEADGEQVFTTDEGDVLLSRAGGALFVSEGLPLAEGRRLREATVAVQGSGPVKLAVGGGELGLGWVARVWDVAGGVGAVGFGRKPTSIDRAD